MRFKCRKTNLCGLMLLASQTRWMVLKRCFPGAAEAHLHCSSLLPPYELTMTSQEAKKRLPRSHCFTSPTHPVLYHGSNPKLPASAHFGVSFQRAHHHAPRAAHVSRDVEMFGLTKAEPLSSTLKTHKILTEDAVRARTREQELKEAGITERALKLGCPRGRCLQEQLGSSVGPVVAQTRVHTHTQTSICCSTLPYITSITASHASCQ